MISTMTQTENSLVLTFFRLTFSSSLEVVCQLRSVNVRILEAVCHLSLTVELHLQLIIVELLGDGNEKNCRKACRLSAQVQFE